MNFTIGIADIIRISPMLALFIASLIPLIVKVLRGNVEPPPQAVLFHGIGGIVAAILLLLTVAGLVRQVPDATAFANALVFDGITVWIGVLALCAAGASLFLMYDNLATVGSQFSELMFLALSATLGMLILVSAMDLLVVFIGLETMSLALYLMIAMSHEQKLSKEAAFKYFVLGGFASAIFLYGVAFIFGTVGSTYLPDLYSKVGELISTNRLFMMGIVMLILGFAFKVSIAPFHAWTPDVYQGAPTPHSALMATAVKAVSFGAFLRIMVSRGLLTSDNLLDILQWLAVITMIVGNVAAIVQDNVKRMLAYSSIAHSGYLLVGLVTIGYSDNISFSASGVIFYLVGYSLMTLGAFALVSLLEKNENSVITFSNLSGYAKKHPLMAFCLTIFLLSLAGIPPTVGFFGKFYLFSAAVSEGLLWLAVWGVLNSVISVYYYLRPIVHMYMQDGEEDAPILGMLPTKTVILVFAVMVVLLGVFSGPLFSMMEAALS